MQRAVSHLKFGISISRFAGAFVGTFLFFAQAQGTVTATAYENASQVDSSNVPNIVYGGTAGASGGCAGAGLCDNCTDAAGTLAACNKSRVHQNTLFKVYFHSDAKAGNAMLADDTNGNSITVTSFSTSVSTGNTAVITVLWSQLCYQIALAYSGTSTDCETIDGVTAMNKAVVLRVGIDANADGKLDATNDDYVRVSFKVQRTIADTVDTTTAGTSAAATNGIYDFSIYPGDEKAYMENIRAWDAFPLSANSTRYTKVHLLFLPFANCAAAAGQFSNILIGQASKSTTQNIESDGNLSDERFYGMTNEVNYVFKIALEDQAGNIGLFTGDGADCIDGKHSQKPGEVFGLLKEEQNCFIATAAFGSPLAKQVQTFRQFRDQVLLKFKLGREFVRSYYNWSPQFAKTIRQNETFRAVARWALYPVWAMASVTLALGGIPTLAIGLALIALGLMGHRTLSQRRRPSK